MAFEAGIPSYRQLAAADAQEKIDKAAVSILHP
jgi:hypothetical protein